MIIYHIKQANLHVSLNAPLQPVPQLLQLQNKFHAYQYTKSVKPCLLMLMNYYSTNMTQLGLISLVSKLF